MKSLPYSTTPEQTKLELTTPKLKKYEKMERISPLQK
jgi:hypothetical protein